MLASLPAVFCRLSVVSGDMVEFGLGSYRAARRLWLRLHTSYIEAYRLHEEQLDKK